MLTRMTDKDWGVVLEMFAAARSRRGDKGRNDRRFLEALHYFTVHNITWRALPACFGNWNSVWKRFWRLSRAGVFEAFWREGLLAYDRLAGIDWTWMALDAAMGKAPLGGGKRWPQSHGSRQAREQALSAD